MTRRMRPLTAIALAVVLAFCSLSCADHVRIGAEMLVDDHIGLLYANKRVGIICNQTSVFPDGTFLPDSLIGLGVKVTALFGPEHGMRGDAGAGESVVNGMDTITHLPVYSLYGKNDRPTDEMLRKIDLLIFDIQDVGARFYTYATTMAFAMEAAGRNGVPFMVLDRPNPINGVSVEGPVLDTAFKSFVGRFPVPIRHGMTMGELAQMIAGERWLGENFHVELTVIAMGGWMRPMWYDQTGLEWVPPSPNMKTESTAIVYPGTCLFEATNISEGRGTPKPFEYIGAPWIDGEKFAGRLRSLNLDSVSFDPITFTPKADPVAAPNPKFEGRLCGGVFVRVRDRNAFKPVETGMMMLEIARELYRDSLTIRTEMMNRLSGTAATGKAISSGSSLKEALRSSDAKLEEFLRLRDMYLLYE